MSYFLKGNWKAGWAIDIHTKSSIHNADGTFDTERTDIGELLYQFKYCENTDVLHSLVEKVSEFTKTLKVMPYISSIIPVPPSDFTRKYQPVMVIAESLSKIINKQYLHSFIKKIKKGTTEK